MDIQSFYCTNADSTVFMLEEALRVLDMPRSKKGEHIRHSVDGIPMVRRSSSQKMIDFNSELMLNAFMIKQIIKKLD